jgi:hypothetical protein
MELIIKLVDKMLPLSAWTRASISLVFGIESLQKITYIEKNSRNEE